MGPKQRMSTCGQEIVKVQVIAIENVNLVVNSGFVPEEVIASWPRCVYSRSLCRVTVEIDICTWWKRYLWNLGLEFRISHGPS